MTTGTVGHADTLKGWFVMVKDSKGRYPGNDCLSCHLPAEASDWICVQGYPSLKR